jgi:hypothetical protein
MLDLFDDVVQIRASADLNQVIPALVTFLK